MNMLILYLLKTVNWPKHAKATNIYKLNHTGRCEELFYNYYTISYFHTTSLLSLFPIVFTNSSPQWLFLCSVFTRSFLVSVAGWLTLQSWTLISTYSTQLESHFFSASLEGLDSNWLFVASTVLKITTRHGPQGKRFLLLSRMRVYWPVT
jgi:hypothetical protein